MKKALLTLGTLGAVVAPIGAVIACGSGSGGSSTSAFESVTLASVAGQATNEAAYVADHGAEVDGTNISLRIRAIDQDVWTKVTEKFNSHHKGHVTISDSTISGTGLIEKFSTASAAGSMDDLNVVDMNVVSYAKQNDVWFQAFDLDSVGKEANKSTYDVFDGQASYGVDKYMSSHVRINSNKNNVSIATPLGYGTKSIYVNATMVTEDAATIHAYAPGEVDAASADLNAQVGLEDVGTFPRVATEQITSGDTSAEKIDKNVAYMQRFLQDAGNRNSILNTPEIKTAHPNWLGYGPGNTYQRIFSAAQSLMATAAKQHNVYAMPFKEGNTSFSLISSAPVDGIYDYKNKVLTKAGFNGQGIKNGGINPALAKYLWQSYGGYMFEANGEFTPFMTADRINQKAGDASGEAEPFMNKRTMFAFKEPWAANMANRGWSGDPLHDKDLANASTWSKPGVTYANGQAYSSGQLRVLGSPYADISVADSLAMTRGLPLAKQIVAKRFIKYITNVAESEKVSFTANNATYTDKTIGEAIAWNYVNSHLDVQEKQKEHIEGKQAGWFQIGQKNAAGEASDLYPSADNGVEGTIWKNTDQDFYVMFETKAWVKIMEYYGFKPSTTAKWTFEQFKAKWDQIMHEYRGNAAIEED